MSISRKIPSLLSTFLVVWAFYSSHVLVDGCVGMIRLAMLKTCIVDDNRCNGTVCCVAKPCDDTVHSGCDGTVCCVAKPCRVDDTVHSGCDGTVCCVVKPCGVDDTVHSGCDGTVCCVVKPCGVDDTVHSGCDGIVCCVAKSCSVDDTVHGGCYETVCCVAKSCSWDDTVHGGCYETVCCVAKSCSVDDTVHSGCDGTVCCVAKPCRVDDTVHSGCDGTVCCVAKPCGVDDTVHSGCDGTACCVARPCGVDDTVHRGSDGTVCCVAKPCEVDDTVHGGCDGTVCCVAKPCKVDENVQTDRILAKEGTAREALFGHYAKSDLHSLLGTTKALGIIYRLLVNLGWDTVTIIHDSNEEASASWLSEKLSSTGMQMRIHTYTSNISIDFSSFSGEDTTLIMCSVTCLSHVLSQASQYAQVNHVESMLRHASRWLITIRHPTSLPVLDVVLDNVAAIFITSPSTQNLRAEERLIYYTLLWSKEGRHFHRITNRELPISVDEELYPNSRRGFNGRKFLVGTLEWHPFVFHLNQTYSGFCVDILNIVRDRLNFTYEFIQPEDKQYGAHIGNGKWSGLIGQLQKKAVEMAITDISITYERERVVDFAFPFTIDATSIIVRDSTDNTGKIWTLTSPFKWEVYVCLTLAFIAVFMMVLAIDLWDCKNSMTSTRTCKRVEIFWYMFGVPFRQGNGQMFRHPRSRVLLGCWWVLTCLMTAVFSGNLVAFLTANAQSPPFETALEMVTQTNFKWGCVSGCSFLTQFKMSNLTVHKLLLEGIQRFSKSDPDILSPHQDVHLKRLLTEDYAFIGGRPLSNYWRSRNCQLRMLKDNLYPVTYSIAFPNGSPYKEIVADIILQLVNTGVIDRLKQAWWPKDKCSQPAKTKGQVVTLVDVQSAFYSILIGVFAAAVVLLVERVHRQCR